MSFSFSPNIAQMTSPHIYRTNPYFTFFATILFFSFLSVFLGPYFVSLDFSFFMYICKFVSLVFVSMAISTYCFSFLFRSLFLYSLNFCFLIPFDCIDILYIKYSTKLNLLQVNLKFGFKVHSEF
jgi:hypothetical protein